jgi:hypothetical protein
MATQAFNAGFGNTMPLRLEVSTAFCWTPLVLSGQNCGIPSGNQLREKWENHRTKWGNIPMRHRNGWIQIRKHDNFCGLTNICWRFCLSDFCVFPNIPNWIFQRSASPFSILLYRWDYSFQDNSVTGIRPEVSETFWNIIELDQANRTRVVATLSNNPKISKHSDEIETHGDRSTLYIPYLGWFFHPNQPINPSYFEKPGTIGPTAPAATAGAFGWSEPLPVPSTPPWPPRLRTFLGGWVSVRIIHPEKWWIWPVKNGHFTYQDISR